MESIKKIIETGKSPKCIPTASTITPAGAIVEMLYEPDDRKTAFAIWENGSWRIQSAVKIDSLSDLAPYSPQNNLVKSGVVLFPSEPEEYGSEEALVEEIAAFIHRYVDVSPFFEKLASYYVLLSWIYDGFNELPYLRGRGDPGSGKTRLLLTVGSICYKPIFASGASTVSPIFRMLDSIRGTLVIDESDFRFSDEKAELTKILNNGNSQGFPVLRSEVSNKGEYNPRAFQVFGPKVLATRGYFDDRALESRFLTEEMGQRALRDDVPINLPENHKTEALHLRNKLLLFRFRNLRRPSAEKLSELMDRSIEPRLNQIFVPLLSVIDDDTIRGEFRELARRYHNDMVAERGMDTEAHVLEIIQSLRTRPENSVVSISEVTQRFAELHADEYERKITNKWIGSIVRRRLGLRTQRSRDGYAIPETELARIERLCEKFGLPTDPGVVVSNPEDGREHVNM